VATVYDCGNPEARQAGLASAGGVLRAGRLVVFPTDTVYGIGADAFNPDAVRGLLEAKGRGTDMPASVLVGSWRTIDGLVADVPAAARALIEAFWPGGLSIVLPHAPSLAWNLGDTKGTVMVRMPLHPVAIELLREFGPMAQSSANATGQPPATDLAQATGQLGEAVEVYLDGGPCAAPVPSTIVDLTGASPLLLREGALSAAAVSEVLGGQVASPTRP
jgi:tRNA threonylcarbamoyl adenosine modification protein (Sua5/YciO/YrdC/YwlC family)